jgi:hypothetical protein
VTADDRPENGKEGSMSTEGPTAPTDISLETRVRPNPDLLSSELEGEAVILDLSSGVYFGLNAVGARIWELIQDGRDLRAVRATLLEEFDVPPDRCEADLMQLVRRMAANGLVNVV